MMLGVVTGQVWGARHCDRLRGHKLLLVRPTAAYRLGQDHVVAIDTVGAEVGQIVVVCFGSPPRWLARDTRVPVDAAVAAIVDGEAR